MAINQGATVMSRYTYAKQQRADTVPAPSVAWFRGRATWTAGNTSVSHPSAVAVETPARARAQPSASKDMYALMALSLGDGRAEGSAGGHGKPVDIATFYAREAQDTQRGARQEALGRLVRDEFRLQCQGGTFDAPRNLFSPADVSYGIAPVRDAALFESEKIAVWQQLNAWDRGRRPSRRCRRLMETPMQTHGPGRSHRQRRRPVRGTMGPSRPGGNAGTIPARSRDVCVR